MQFIFSSRFLATLDAGSVSISNALIIVLIGFSFVVMTLALLTAVTAVIGCSFARRSAIECRQAAEASQLATKHLVEQLKTNPPSPATARSDDLGPEEEDPHYLAVVAAAVHSVFGDRAHRIISIRNGDSGWAQEGRRQIFSSHRVR
jgi:Na+-transporting methylmalonyl-CoA/oxaloacetate decarboxylase gamma subunit